MFKFFSIGIVILSLSGCASVKYTTPNGESFSYRRLGIQKLDGFNLSKDEVYDFLEINEDENAIAIAVHNAVEQFILNYCNRDFEAANFVEYYSGLGSQKLLLKNYPIINIKGEYLATADVIKIYNTNKYTSAIVSVVSTGINLENK